ncbi:MAG: hypothetical protein FJX37_03660, partial [Alphaproteobacteria bacterium]|nr:hypothetical protein [Alphaproteobacteria bacterium]
MPLVFRVDLVIFFGLSGGLYTPPGTETPPLPPPGPASGSIPHGKRPAIGLCKAPMIRINLALGGGGARGLAHIAMLEA